ncbi:MAG: class I SAM-dependent RNA methyltransferase [PVC group bacterium]|nr:class I SAM-dependent RNA methyltransferase [PVC group bacterium]
MKTYKTKIYDLSFGGAGVGKVDGKVCFVRGALPEEEVVFNVEKETSSYIKGLVIELLNTSSDRIEPKCKYYNVCGGCQYQHLTYEKEIFYKKLQVEDLVRRFGGINDFKTEIIASKDPYEYRSSITLHKADKGYGFCRYNSNEIIGIDQCSIASKSINKLLPIAGEGAQKDRLTLKEDCSGRVWRSDRKEDKFFTDTYADKDMVFSPRIFSQCNRYIALKIAEELKGWIQETDNDSAFFDMYCGAGFFSFLLPDFVLKVGMDYEGIAIDCAKKTLKNVGFKNHRFYKGDVDRLFKSVFNRNKKAKNILLLDPPRKGLSKNLIKILTAMNDIDAFYYVSCDPSTLARDIKLLCSGSCWQLERFKVFDMFPRTYHVECLAEFKRGE